MIVIFTPYGRNEVTAAAIRLADVAIEAGLNVKLVAVGVQESHVHSFWDSRVICAHEGGIYRAAKGAEHCVWFTHSILHRDMAYLVTTLSTSSKSKSATHTLVPSLHSLRQSDVPSMLEYDCIITPTKLGCDLIKTHVYGGNIPDNKTLCWTKFDAGLPYTKKVSTVRTAQTRLVFSCDSFSIDECPLITLNTMKSLLEWRDDIAVTALCTKTWSKRDRIRLRDLSMEHGERFCTVYQRDFQGQLDIFQRHDWLLLPGVRSDFGITASRGLACGLPVICYDVSPFAELVEDGYNGAVVQCETIPNWMNLPTAAVNSTDFLERCHEVLREHDTLEDLQSKEWNIKNSGVQFSRLWLTMWGLQGYNK